MRRVLTAGVVVSAALLVACASGGPAAPVTDAGSTPAKEAPAVPAEAPSPALGHAARSGSLAAYLEELSRVSCPSDVGRTNGEAIELDVTSAPLQALNPSRKKIGELTFVAGFHLTSPDKRFGGLSGIDVLENGNLLAVSDQGEFVWIDLGEDGLTPKFAHLAAMRDAKGDLLQGKAQGDSEGVAVNGGMALVSFERDHRVLAYDIGRCGASARGAPIVMGPYGEPLARAFGDAGINVGANQGAEPLALTPDWYLFTGIETKVDTQSPLSARPIEATPDFDLRLGKDAPEFVGLDVVSSGKDQQGVRAFSLHRGFSVLAGNAIAIVETDFGRTPSQSGLPPRVVSEIDERARYRFEPKAAKILAQLNILFNIDNFEGIAARELPDGRVRLYLISDDNFSKTQRTLLFVFETVH